MIGYTEVHVVALERALIAYRANHTLMTGILEECRREGEKRFDALPIASRRKFYAKWFGFMGFKTPTRSEKLRYFDGGYGVGLCACLADEWYIIDRIATELDHVDDVKFYDWYSGIDKKEYKELLTLFQNTQGDSLLLSSKGCEFLVKWGEQYV